MHQQLPEIAIVGRPNVGKSTLFNRLLGGRRAITDATPGVTRDAVTATGTLAGLPVRLTDTGGITDDDQDPLTEEVSRRALMRAGAAEVVLLVLDVTGLTGEDRELLELMRPQTDRVLLVVNKVDHPGREAIALADFSALGYQPVFPVSAAHGLGIAELQAEILKRLPIQDNASVPAEQPPVRLALVGRPNSGKSTLLNRLTGTEEALVHDQPGTTRDFLEVPFSHDGEAFIAVDTAGIRRRPRVTGAVEYYSVQRAMQAVTTADVVVLLVDAQRGLADQDKKIASIVMQSGAGLVIGLNKWDALEHVENRLEAMTDRIRFLFPVLEFAPVKALSARTGLGVDQMMRTVVQVRRQLDHRVSTPDLNKALQRWVGDYAQAGDVRSRVKYGTQLDGRPPHFAFFSNRRRGLSANYAAFLRNRIRQEFGFNLVPVTVDVRPSAQRGVGRSPRRPAPREP